MAEYVFGGTDEENAELKKLNAEVLEDTDDFDNWEKLVRAAEGQEGGINRNSSPNAITATRSIYDRFLAKFPLLFGYWKKYADLEFAIAGTEASEMVYERGVASISNSVDLWTSYCSFKVDTCHDPDITRELFERGADCVGLDFLSHLFWDKYLEFEERVEAPDRIFAILGRVIQIPMHQYARYIERYRQMAQLRPVTELAPPELLIQFRAEVDGPAQGIPPGMKSELELERDMRLRINAYHMEILTRTQTETTKRWTYEAEIKRPYFHVTELDEGQLANWRKYLDFEEAEGSYERITFLYERCLVTCAQYDEFWARYARWMSAQDGKEEEVRNIYQRACAIYVPIALPAIRLRYAYFEEMCGRVDVAKDIHYAILIPMPSHTETIASLANLFRRHDGLDAAVEVYRSMLEVPEISIPAKADIVGKWARLLWKIKGSPEEARQVFQQNQQFYSDSRSFWLAYLQFELDQPTSEKTESVQYQKIKLLVESIRMRATLPAATIRELVQVYMDYLLVRGTSGSATEYMTLDREVNGPPSVLTAALKQQEIKDAKARSRQPSLTAMTPVDPYSYSMSNGSVPLA